MSEPTYAIRWLLPADAALLLEADPQLFERPLDRKQTEAFLGDPRHHIVVALFGPRVIGSAIAIHQLHPDRSPTLLLVEMAVAPEHQRRGIAKKLLRALLAHGRSLGCTHARVGTEADNIAARRLYAWAGGRIEQDAQITYSFDLG
jgi:ribosomal protein S18 acetylase RimI-like enzyme